MVWDQWNSSHSGPVMDYIARCPNDNCQNFKGSTGLVWVKIGQLAHNPGAGGEPWASDFLRTRGARWDVTIPPGLAPGSYLLRHEILGLHVAGQRLGAQFYPSCTHIRVTSGGSLQLPSGVALPGAYNPDDREGVSDKSSQQAKTIFLWLGEQSGKADMAARFLSSCGGSTRARSHTRRPEDQSGAVLPPIPTDLGLEAGNLVVFVAGGLAELDVRGSGAGAGHRQAGVRPAVLHTRLFHVQIDQDRRCSSTPSRLARHLLIRR